MRPLVRKVVYRWALVFDDRRCSKRWRAHPFAEPRWIAGRYIDNDLPKDTAAVARLFCTREDARAFLRPRQALERARSDGWKWWLAMTPCRVRVEITESR